MKFAIDVISLFLFAAPFIASAGESVLPQFPAAVICFNGKLDAGSSCEMNPAPMGQPLAKSGKITCGFPGKVSEISWSFVERREGKDVYTFTRRFPIESPETTTATKQIPFGGARVIVFEDQFQVIVIQGPEK